MTHRARVALIAYAVLIASLFGSLALEHYRVMGYAEAQPVSVAPRDALPSPLIDAGVIDAPTENGSETMSATSPVEQAKQAGDTQWTLVEDYGPIWGGMLVLFGLGYVFVRRNPGHILGQGHTLSLAVGAVGLLGSLLEANFTTASGAGVPITLAMVIKLLLQRPKA